MPIEKRKILAVVCALASLLGCNVPQAPLPPIFDAGPRDAASCPECPDTGRIVFQRDGGQDGGPPVDANVDAAPFDAGTLADAGTSFAIEVDGRLTDPEWLELEPLVSTATPLEPFGSEHLDTLRFFRDEVNLYIGFEAGLTSGNRIVLYVDLGTTAGDVLLTTSGLGDTSGAVDTALSIPIAADIEFAPELGWGTAAMPNAASAGSDSIGWRRLATAGAFTLITRSTRSVCTSTACETAISLESIGATPSSPIDFVVRLGRPDVGWSNQTFPAFSSGTPEFVDFTVEVPAAAL